MKPITRSRVYKGVNRRMVTNMMSTFDQQIDEESMDIDEDDEKCNGNDENVEKIVYDDRKRRKLEDNSILMSRENEYEEEQ